MGNRRIRRQVVWMLKFWDARKCTFNVTIMGVVWGYPKWSAQPRWIRIKSRDLLEFLSIGLFRTKGRRTRAVEDGREVSRSCGNGSWCRRSSGKPLSASRRKQGASVRRRKLNAWNPASATPLSRRERYRHRQPPTPGTTPLSMATTIRSIRTIARLSFRRKARNLDSARVSVRRRRPPSRAATSDVAKNRIRAEFLRKANDFKHRRPFVVGGFGLDGGGHGSHHRRSSAKLLAKPTVLSMAMQADRIQ